MLSGKDEIPLHGKLIFVVTTKDVFPRTQKIEVATANEGVKTTLSLADNNLVLQDDHTAVVTLNPLKAFGQSAFGPLAMRPIAADGSTGDWTRLGVLVRTPEISEVKCMTADATTCAVNGKNLFLVQSFGAGKDFAKSADVPTGFAQGEFAVPAPADGTTLYLKLRDDPASQVSVRCLRVGGKTTGAMGFEGLEDPELTAGPLISLATASQERTRAFQKASESASPRPCCFNC